MFKASDVKELREKTGAGMMDCKKALEACDGKMDEAVDWLREKGIAKAAKKESRIAAEGITVGLANDNEAIIFEVNCETDFVTKNEKFNELVKELRDTLVSEKCNNTEEALKTKMKDGKTVQERIVEETATIGEKISFRRFQRITKNDDEVFGIYSHMGGKITTLVVLDGSTPEVAKDVAMHTAAMRPTYLNSDEVPSDVLDKEKNIMKEQLLNEGKPEDRIEQILVGKVNKFYEEVCLENQIFIKAENKETVGKYVANNGGKLVKMVRYEVGEGMEKRNENFAEEVQNQING